MFRALAVKAAAVPRPLSSRLPTRPVQLASAVFGGRWASTGSGSGLVVAYPGGPGSLSNIGAKQFFRGTNAELEGVNSVKQTFEAVSQGEVSFGVIPFENSTSGTVHAVFDLLFEHDVVIAGDLGVHEKYCLCVNEGVDLASIRTVTSHPVILEACSEFVHQKLQKGQDLIGAVTTCEAATSLAQSAAKDTAVIATHEAAALHGLKVLATDIGNDVHAETRYILIRRAQDNHLTWTLPSHLEHSTNASTKHSVCVAVDNKPGAIFKLLSCWALRDINVVRMESRPLSTRQMSRRNIPSGVKIWDSIYHIDHLFEPGTSKEEAQQVWNAVCEFSKWQHDFGTYTSLVSRSEKKAKTFDEMYQTMTWG